MGDRKQIGAAAGAVAVLALVLGLMLGNFAGGDGGTLSQAGTPTTATTDDGSAGDKASDGDDTAGADGGDDGDDGASADERDEAEGSDSIDPGDEGSDGSGSDGSGSDGSGSDGSDSDDSDSDGSDSDGSGGGLPDDVLEDLAESIPDPVEEDFDTPTPDLDEGLPTVSPCDTGTFRQGRWHVEGTGGTPADVQGMYVEPVMDDLDCVRLRVLFDGAVPDFEVMSMSPLWHTRLLFDGADAPDIPVSPDGFRARDGELIDTAMLTHRLGGLGVFASHHRSNDVAARAVVGDGHIDVFLRPSRDGDERVDDDFGGEPFRPVMLGRPVVDGLAVTYLVELTPGELVVAGFAKAPEGVVEVRLHDEDGEVCRQEASTEGPSHLLSHFETACGLDPGTYDVEIGWPSPTGDPADAVWVLESIEIRG